MSLLNYVNSLKYLNYYASEQWITYLSSVWEPAQNVSGSHNLIDEFQTYVFNITNFVQQILH